MLRVLMLVVVSILGLMYWQWSTLINLFLPSDSRPVAVSFPVESVTADQFEELARHLESKYQREFVHIEEYRKNGITAYEGPKTCLACHNEIEVTDPLTGIKETVNPLANLLESAHYKFFTIAHDDVFGFNGKSSDGLPMGKINRLCPKPGSFALTAWAETVKLADGSEMSEGCGQCHVGGQGHPPRGNLFPGYQPTAAEKDAIDCLICHSLAYDMNRKQVVVDDSGLQRWAQDRSMKAALSVTRPTSQTCLRCHQHNLGGDIYIDEADPSYMESLQNPGYEKPRVMHPGSKRGTPFSPTWDVHAAAGMNCIDCHTTKGHLMAKGTHTTTIMANDLPGVAIECESCHGSEPHQEDEMLAELYNMHNDKLACQICHIPDLHPDSVTYRDFASPAWEEHPGIYIYDDVVKESAPGKGIMYAWWNGTATFMGNPIGDNPNGAGLYRFYKPDKVWPEFKDYDYQQWYESTMRPIAQQGPPSKLYPLKRFNGRQHVDLHNMGPFGAMYVPYNLPHYYAEGDADAAVSLEMGKPMMKMLYGRMFKWYLLDQFMAQAGVDGWDVEAYRNVVALEKVEPRWIPQDAGIEISHAIRRKGALTCDQCHSESGVLNWADLGYTGEEISVLQQNPLE